MTLMIGCQHRHLATDACRNNLRLIDSAKQEWMREQHKTATDVPTWDDLREYMGRSGTTGPIVTCPSGGSYTLGRVGEKPACSIAGHGL